MAEQPARLVIENGVIDTETIKRDHIALDEVFMMLRQAGVESLGQVRLAYLETSGHLSTFLFPPQKVRAGLPLLPPPENFSNEDLRKLATSGEQLVCAQCGTLPVTRDSHKCNVCESERFIPAMKPSDFLRHGELDKG